MILLNHLIDIYRIIRYSVFNPRFPYKKRYSGKVCILGGGPSLHKTLEATLKDKNQYYYFGLNDFAVSDSFEVVKPSFYIFLDPAYWMSEKQGNPKDIEMRKRTFDIIIKRTSWPMTIFIPSTVYRMGIMKSLVNNTSISLAPMNRTSLMTEDSNLYYWSLKKNYSGDFNNVLAGAVYCSINLGFEEIYIMGAEHSWSKDIRVNEDNQVCTISRHFYEEEESLTPWLKSNTQPYKMYEILRDLSRTFKGYTILSKYASLMGCRVYNVTPDSFIDAFKKVTI